MSDTQPALLGSPPEHLADRGVVSVSGLDAAAFLHNLVSANIERLGEGDATYAALLMPQGKILFDFIVVRYGGDYLIDVAADQAAGFAKRLGFYKLRSQVTIADRSSELAVVACSPADVADLPDSVIAFSDPRLATLGTRAIVPVVLAATLPDAGADYERLRISLAIPRFGADFASGDVVPHDINFDDLNAIDFRKGCYVGQEIVSRMKHRGTARRRLVHVRPADGISPVLPDRSSEILAGIRSIGTMGSSIDGRGLAIIRLDWAKDALDRGIPITSGGVALAVDLPVYATFSFPETTADA